MTLIIQTEENDQRQMTLNVEVPESRVQKEMRQVARKLAKDVNVPGFRKGKAPYGVIVKRFGKEAVRAEAIEELVQPIFEDAVNQEEFEVYGQPSFDDLNEDPLSFKYTFSLPPLVELGDYRSIRKDVPAVTIEENAVQEALDHLRSHHVASEEVDRPVAAGDMITISGRGEIIVEEDWDEEEETESDTTETDEATEVSEVSEVDETSSELEELEDDEDEIDILFDTESTEFLLDSQKLYLGAPFIEQVIGLSAGESKNFTITYPEDHDDEELAGKEVEFEVTILNVKSYDLPELTDELAKEEGAETVDELTERTRENLIEEAKQQAQNDILDQMVDELIELASIVYPPNAVEMEIDDMIESYKDQIQRSGWEMSDYLTIQGQTEADLREDFRESATSRLKRNLVLRQLLLDEKITVDIEDVDALIEKRVSAFAENAELKESMMQFYRQGYGFEMISSEILMKKTAERVEAIFTGNAPDLDALDETDEEE